MTMKARDKGPRPPYVTYATWVRVLEDVRERKPTQLDGSYFRDIRAFGQYRRHGEGGFVVSGVDRGGRYADRKSAGIGGVRGK